MIIVTSLGGQLTPSGVICRSSQAPHGTPDGVRAFRASVTIKHGTPGGVPGRMISNVQTQARN